MNKSLFCLLIIGFAAVLADNYLCPTKEGELFECFESDHDYRACLTNGHPDQAYIVCSKCKRKWEFCVTNGEFSESKHPKSDCGENYESTPCTPSNSEWSSAFSYRKH